MKDYFKKPITDQVEAIHFIDRMAKDDLLFHFDDRAEDILIIPEGADINDPDVHVRLFTDEEAELVNKRVDEVFEYVESPHEYVVVNYYNDFEFYGDEAKK